jgi:predicted metal-dependent peptidase
MSFGYEKIIHQLDEQIFDAKKKGSTSVSKPGHDENGRPTPELLKKCKAEIGDAICRGVRVLFDGDGEFFAHILAQMERHIDDPRIGTAAVSVTSKINFYANSYFFCHTLVSDLDMKKDEDRTKAAQRWAAVIKHEIGHVICHHMLRSQDFGNQALANVAADLVVNSWIDKRLLQVGVDEQGKPITIGMFPEDFKLPKDESLGYYYDHYPIDKSPLCMNPHGHDKQHQQNQQQNGQQQGQQQGQQGNQQGNQSGQGNQQGNQSGQGNQQGNQSGQGNQPGGHGGQSGQGGSGQPGQQGGQQQGSGGGGGHDHAVDEHGNCKVCGGKRPMDDHSIWTTEGNDGVSKSMKESLVKDAILRAASNTKDAGNLPNAIKEMIELAKKKPQIPWALLLRQFVSRLSNAKLKHVKKRISKRYGTRPGIKLIPRLKLGCAPDVSGSVSNEEYQLFMAEIFAIAKATGCEVEVIEWDTEMYGPYKIKGYKKNIERRGSGGTDPTKALEYFNKKANHFDGLVVLTDGHLFCDITKKSLLPVMWVITPDGTKDHLKNQRVIRIPKKEEA